jgi:hypothetical protein
MLLHMNYIMTIKRELKREKEKRKRNKLLFISKKKNLKLIE